MKLFSIQKILLMVLIILLKGFFCKCYCQIIIQNPSFEGIPSNGAVANSWQICSATPDILPGNPPCLNYPSFDGVTYHGIGSSDISIFYGIESFGQILTTSMIAEKTYRFSIYLSKTASLTICGGTLPIPINFEVWGGLTPCSRTKKLAEVDTIDHIGWREYVIEFTADDNYPFIEFLSNSKDPDVNKRGYLLLDNMSPEIYEYPWLISITSPQNNSTQSCTFLVEGEMDQPPGSILGLHSSLLNQDVIMSYFGTDTSWSAMLNYPTGTSGVDTLILRANFSAKPTEMGYDTLIINVSPKQQLTTAANCGEKIASIDYRESQMEDDSTLSVKWYLGEGTSFTASGKDTSFTKEYPELKTYPISVVSTSAKGCKDSTSRLITLSECHSVPVIYNLVTKNGDGQNDFFRIDHLNANHKLEIFNRWGDRVYQSSHYQNNWPDKPISDGVYYYHLSMQGEHYKGWLQIVSGE